MPHWDLPLNDIQKTKMIFKIIPLILIILKPTKCEMEKYSPKTIYVSNYCPKMKYCRDGAHVMCVYYDHKSVVGPRCINYVNTKLTHEMVDQILESVNAIRSKVATGTETGLDDQLLPRAYGMMKIEWDNELATFAQVLANQCLGGREDECHATDRFPNPSQSVSVIQFKHPDWLYLSRNTTDLGLNDEKIMFAIEKFIKTSYSLKETVSRNVIINCPSTQRLDELKLKYYLNLIRGTTTHIGCGLSAYTKFNNDEKQSIYNRIELVCNFSDSPQSSQPLYMTDPPIPGTGFSDRCGCPRGYRETMNCLCEEDEDAVNIPTTPAAKELISYETQNQEEATQKNPPAHPKKQTWTNLMPSQNTPSSDTLQTSSKSQIGRQQPLETCANPTDNCGSDNVVLLPLISIQNLPSEDANVERPNVDYTNYRRHLPSDNASLGRGPKRMQQVSSFSDDEYKKTSSKMKMKANKNTRTPKRGHKKEAKRFGPVVSSTEDKNNMFNVNLYEAPEPEFNGMDIIIGNQEHNSRPKTKKDVHDNKTNLKRKFHDNKLMSVLEALEKEVHHVELNKIEKQRFDMKMRKIYKAVLNKSKNKEILFAQQTTPNIEKDFQEIQDIISHRPKLNFIKERIRPRTYHKYMKDIKRPNFKEKKPLDIDSNKNYKNQLIRKAGEDAGSNYNPAEDKFLNILRQNSFIDNLINNLEDKYKHNGNEDDTDILRKTEDEPDKSDREASDKTYRNDDNDERDVPAERIQETILAQDIDEKNVPSDDGEPAKSDESDGVIFRGRRTNNYNKNESNRGIAQFFKSKNYIDGERKRFPYLSNPRRAQNIQSFRRLMGNNNEDPPLRSMLPSRGSMRLGTRIS